MRPRLMAGIWFLLMLQLLAAQGKPTSGATLLKLAIPDVVTKPAEDIIYLYDSSQGIGNVNGLELTQSVSNPDSAALDGNQDLDTTITLRAEERARPNLTQQPILGWLELAGDTGTTVWLNGSATGTTPLERLPLHKGSYQLILTKPEHHWYGADVAVEYDRVSTVNYTLQKRPRKTAITLSMVLPGSGQIYQGYYKGWFYLELALVLGYSTLVFQQDFSVHHDAYDRGLENYNNETDASVALRKREIVQEDFDAMKKAEVCRNISLGTLGVVWFINIVDIAF